MIVLAGMDTNGLVAPASLSFQPETSAGVVPMLVSSTQSATVSPLDSTSLSFTLLGSVVDGQELAAPLVGAAVVVKAPSGPGHRPYVVVACAVHE